MIEPRTDRELVGGDVEGGNARDGEQEEEREEKHASLKRHGRALGRKSVEKQPRWLVYKREEKKEEGNQPFRRLNQPPFNLEKIS